MTWLPAKSTHSLKRQLERAWKGLNATSGAQFGALPLVEPILWPARAIVTVDALSLLILRVTLDDVPSHGQREIREYFK